jgi:hypothetical protein
MGAPAGQSSGCTLIGEAETAGGDAVPGADNKNRAAVKVGNRDMDDATRVLLISTPSGSTDGASATVV